MVSTNKNRMNLRRFAGLSLLPLAIAGMMAPTLAAAQERGSGRVERMPDSGPRQQQAPQSQPDPSGERRQQNVDGARQGWQGQARQGRDGQRQEGQRREWRGQANGQSSRGPESTGAAQGRPAESWRQNGRRDGWQANRNGWQGSRDGRDGNQAGDQRVNRGNDRNGWQGGNRPSDNRESWRGGNSWNNDRGGDRAWNRGWRSNDRYNWSSYRSSNRGIYRLGRYNAPYNSYSYRRLGLGYTLGSLFYGQSYWVSNPWSYRLPDVYGGYRWVRYYNDVLLVDTYSGEVVDAIYDFFW